MAEKATTLLRMAEEKECGSHPHMSCGAGEEEERAQVGKEKRSERPLPFKLQQASGEGEVGAMTSVGQKQSEQTSEQEEGTTAAAATTATVANMLSMGLHLSLYIADCFTYHTF